MFTSNVHICGPTTNYFSLLGGSLLSSHGSDFFSSFSHYIPVTKGLLTGLTCILITGLVDGLQFSVVCF